MKKIYVILYVCALLKINVVYPMKRHRPDDLTSESSKKACYEQSDNISDQEINDFSMLHQDVVACILKQVVKNCIKENGFYDFIWERTALELVNKQFRQILHTQILTTTMVQDLAKEINEEADQEGSHVRISAFRLMYLLLSDNLAVRHVQGEYLRHANQLGEELMHNICSTSDIDIVKKLISQGANVDFEDEHGDTALIRAVRLGNEEIIAALIQSGAYIDCQNKHGDTALLAAFKCGHYSIVYQLIDFGAQVNLQDDDGYTILHYASELPQDQSEPIYQDLLDMVRRLLAVQADTQIRNEYGRTPYDLARDIAEENNRVLLELFNEHISRQ